MNPYHSAPSGTVLPTLRSDPPGPIVVDRGSGLLKCWLCGMLIVTLLTAIAEVQASSVLQLNLKDLCNRAEKIIRATVIEIKTGTVEAGGGKIPTVTYRLRVMESLGGQALGVMDLTMVGSIKGEVAQGTVRRFPLFADFPQLEQGQEYLLFTTSPSRIGLCTIVGLGQGCFKVYSKDKKEYAVNTANNRGLALGVTGPVEYVELVKRIRELRGN